MNRRDFLSVLPGVVPALSGVDPGDKIEFKRPTVGHLTVQEKILEGNCEWREFLVLEDGEIWAILNLNDESKYKFTRPGGMTQTPHTGVYLTPPFPSRISSRAKENAQFPPVKAEWGDLFLLPMFKQSGGSTVLYSHPFRISNRHFDSFTDVEALEWAKKLIPLAKNKMARLHLQKIVKDAAKKSFEDGKGFQVNVT